MTTAINPNAPSDQSLPVQGFDDISPLGCAFANMMAAFATMYTSMQTAGIEEAKLSTAYNESGVKVTDLKEQIMQKLRTEENKWEWWIANNPGNSYSYHHQLQLVQAKEGQVKSLLGAMVTKDQTAGSNASDEFSGALKGMNGLFDCAKEGLNKVVGTAMQLGNPIARQHG